MRGWLLARGVPKGIERVQFDTWFTMDLLDYSLSHMVENFSQDYLIETIENEAETSLNPGAFPGSLLDQVSISHPGVLTS